MQIDIGLSKVIVTKGIGTMVSALCSQAVKANDREREMAHATMKPLFGGLG